MKTVNIELTERELEVVQSAVGLEMNNTANRIHQMPHNSIAREMNVSWLNTAEKVKNKLNKSMGNK